MNFTDLVEFNKSYFHIFLLQNYVKIALFRFMICGRQKTANRKVNENWSGYECICRHQRWSSRPTPSHIIHRRSICSTKMSGGSGRTQSRRSVEYSLCRKNMTRCGRCRFTIISIRNDWIDAWTCIWRLDRQRCGLVCCVFVECYFVVISLLL